MKPPALFLLRVGVGLTFLITGFLMFHDPDTWLTYLQPWIRDLIPFPIHELMFGIAGFNVAIGLLLVLGIWTWLASFLGALYFMIIIITTGMTVVTILDIGLLAATLALSMETLPKEWNWFSR